MIRSNQQNKALHKYLRDLSVKLNDAGLDQRKVLKPSVAIPWDEKSAKDRLWRQIQIAMTGKESSKDLTTKEVSKIYEVLNRHLVEKFGPDAHIPFPSQDELYYKENYDTKEQD